MTETDFENLPDGMDDKIKKAFAPKEWHEIMTNDSWSVFKVMSELVDGFDKLARIGPCLSVFGSARTKKNKPDFFIRASTNVFTGA